jgi:hypothetical protein
LDHLAHLKRTATYVRVMEELVARTNERPAKTTASTTTSEVSTRRSQSAAAIAAATGQHRVAKRGNTVLTMKPITELNHDERELMIQCVKSAQDKKLQSEAAVFEFAQNLYVAEMARNAGLHRSQQRNLTGPVTAHTMMLEYRRIGYTAATKQSQVAKRKRRPVGMGKKVAATTKHAKTGKVAHKGHVNRAATATTRIEARDPITLKTNDHGDVYFDINGHKIGDRQNQCLGGKDCSVCTTSDNESMRYYLKLMAKETPYGDKLNGGGCRRSTKCKESTALLDKLSTFFKFRKSKTFTPE